MSATPPAGEFDPLPGPVRVGVCGLGFMGRTHLQAFSAARAAGVANRIAAVADRNAHRRAGRLDGGGNIDTGADDEALFDAAAVEAFADPFELVRAAEVDLVSIATPTDTHVALGTAALESGRHVLIEKPVALDAAGVARLADAARAAGRVCMPAMCVRFWPGWDLLREAIRDGRHGRLRTLAIRRLAARPDWSAGFYGDPARTGGALFDLHVHDADFVRWCLGDPADVHVRGHLDHVFASYDFGPEGPDGVWVEGGWDHAPGFPFQMAFTAVFEAATLDYDARRDTALLLFDAETTAGTALELDPRSGYDLEVEHLLESLLAGSAPSVGLEDALAVTRLIERERRALQRE